MSIELISIGDELLSGATVNTNAAYLSLKLVDEGWKVARQTTLPDEPAALTQGLREALQRASFVISTGGLGPTHDDVSAAAAQTLFSSLPELLPNPIGSAPGLLFEKKLLMLPGVPQEMRAVFEGAALPLLRKHLTPDSTEERAVLHFCLLPEVELDPMLRELQKRGIRSGIYPTYGTVTVRLYAPSRELLDDACRLFQEKWPLNLFSTPSGKIEEAVQAELTARRQTLALAESCTGGLIAAHLTALPEASDYFLGSCVVYANRLKEQLLGVSPETLRKHGAVSEETVKEMLEGVFERTGADWGIAVSGIAGPSGGTAQKPVGMVWYALGAKGEEPVVGQFDLQRKNRETIILISTNRLLALIWQKICADKRLALPH